MLLSDDADWMHVTDVAGTHRLTDCSAQPINYTSLARIISSVSSLDIADEICLTQCHVDPEYFGRFVHNRENQRIECFCSQDKNVSYHQV